jgi:hypothetical protein
MLTALIVIVAGCSNRHDPDAINLEAGLRNTESGEYSLSAVSNVEGARFVSFQKSADHKRQYYFEADERMAVLEKVAAAVKKARQNGHVMGTMGGGEIFE